MNNNLEQKPENLFCTKHVLSVVSVFYLSTLSPVIDKAINDSLTKKDIGNLINATLVAFFAASTKAFDPYVYTPKGLPGRNKDDILSSLDPIINTVQTVQSTQTAIQNPSIFSVSGALQDINNSIKTINTSTNPIKNVTTLDKDIIPLNTIINPIKNVTTLDKDIIPLNTIINPIKTDDIKMLQFPESSANTRLELITRQDTFYKLEPIDSTLLDLSKKVEVRENIQLFIDDYYIDKETNHIIFNIDERIFYAFLDHIQLLDGGVQLLF